MTTTTQRGYDEEYYEFERAVGVPGPYKYVTCFEIPGSWLAEANPWAYQNALRELAEIQRSLGVAGGCCDRCGMPLTYNHVLQGQNGRRFVVGSECVLKRGRITSEAKEAQKRVERARAAAKAKAYQIKKRKEFLAQIGAVDFQDIGSVERQANDLSRQMRLEAEEDRLKREARVSAEQNAWLIDVLQDGRGGFCDSVCETMRRSALSRDNFSDRQLRVMVDIYARRAGGRAGSKAWREACVEFGKKSGLGIEVYNPYGRTWEWGWLAEGEEDEDQPR